MKRRKFIKDSAIVGLSVTNPMLINANSGIENGGKVRKIHRVMNADRTMVGTLPILRAFAGNHLDYVSPFVLFDEFGPIETAQGAEPLRVDAHPHAGVIPTTYFLEGSGHHKDSLNYDFQIGKGDFMVFSSGRGAIHMEESGQQNKDEGGLYHGFQIWLNMPAKHKWDAPTTNVFKDEHMGIINEKNYSAKVVLGELNGVKSKIETLSPAFYFHLKMSGDCRLDIPTDPTHNAFVYMINGKVELEGQRQIKENQVVFYERGESIINMYSECGAECLILGGQPLNETVFSYGPFVMNTEEEIRKCIHNYQTGKMGNPDLVN